MFEENDRAMIAALSASQTKQDKGIPAWQIRLRGTRYDRAPGNGRENTGHEQDIPQYFSWNRQRRCTESEE